MSASTYFTSLINQLPKGLGGKPTDQEKQNLYWGLLELARQLDRIEHGQNQIRNELHNVSATVQRLR